MQPVSGAVGFSKNERAIFWVQALACGEGLAKATWATLGIVTSVEFGSVRATSGPKEAAVCPSYSASTTRVGIWLWVTSRTSAGSFGTFQAAQFCRMNGRFVVFAQIDRGKVGKARRP